MQPYIVLGLALRTRGHNVRVATEERLRPLVEEFGMTFAKIDGDSTGLLFQVMLFSDCHCSGIDNYFFYCLSFLDMLNLIQPAG